MDSEYLKMHVGDALTRGLAEVVKIRPSDPIEYLAFWLQKYVENRDHAKQVWPNITISPPAEYGLCILEIFLP